MPQDYARWAAASGEPEWAWDAVLPLFRGVEDNIRGADAWHGTGGPLGVSDLRYHNPLSDALIESAEAAGFGRNPDFNGPRQAGFGLYQVTQRDGLRCSSAAAFLAPARDRPNLTVSTRTLTERVLIDRGRAVGVQVRPRGGESRRIEAGEVVLCGGAINSPQLLLLSGIGPADHLRAHGVPVVLDQPQVGENLQDHLDVCTLVSCTQPVTYDRINVVAAGLKFLLTRQGVGTSNAAEAGGFVRSRFAEDERCDLQFHFVPALLDDHGRHRLPGRGYTLHACVLHPHSRGRIRLRSADPAAHPAIHANYLSDAEGFDLLRMVEAARVSREILAQSPFDAYRGPEIFPGAQVNTAADLVAFIRRKAETVYHPVGSCRMGGDDASVVDGRLRVRGIGALRVVDASVMPEVITGNTNAPAMMIAERVGGWMRCGT